MRSMSVCIALHLRARFAAPRPAGQRPVRIQPHHDDAADVRGWGTSIRVVGTLDTNERYFSLLDNGERDVWVIARDDEKPPRLRPKITTLRRGGVADALFQRPSVKLVASKSASHNLAATFWRGHFLAMGGQDQNRSKGFGWSNGVAFLEGDGPAIAATAPHNMTPATGRAGPKRHGALKMHCAQRGVFLKVLSTFWRNSSFDGRVAATDAAATRIFL